MKLQLVFKTAKSKGKKSRIYDVDLPVVIGRGQRASFRIPHGQISRCHCELLESKGSVFIRDLGFLQTDDRWIVFLDDSLELIKPHADAVHVK